MAKKQVNSNVIGLVAIVIFIVMFAVLFSFEVFFEHTRSDSNTLGYVENVRIVYPNGTRIVQAKIDTGAVESSISESLAEELGLDATFLKNKTIITTAGKQNRQTIPIKFYLNNKLIDTIATLSNRSELEYPLLVGRNDLHGFIIDTMIMPANAPPERWIDSVGITNLIPYGAIQIPLILAVLSVLVVFIRTVLGIKTYGIFAPLIISLTFITMGLKNGLLVYLALLVLGISADKLLGHLRFMSVSRSSINLHLLTIFIGVVFVFLNIANTDHVILALPFIIMIHLIERFNKESEMHGTKSSMMLLLNTFVIAGMSYFMIDYFEDVLTQNKMFILFGVSFILSIILAFYSGIRLTELTRFFKDKETFGKTILNFLKPQFLGMNYRNMVLIDKYNPKEAIELVNDKIRYKELLMRHKVPTPKMLDVISYGFEIPKRLHAVPAPFVIKPANGSAGKGILIIDAKKGGEYIDNKGERLSESFIQKHMLLMLEGRFSMGVESDEILIEEKITANSMVASLSETGLPDVRLIIFKGRIVAAMARIPTKKSGGKANISQGALAADVDIKTGKILGVYDKLSRKRLEPIPKNMDMVLPHWKKVVEIGLRGAELSDLGYSGIDIIYDMSGPMIMECNGHPGMEIQNVTGINILDRVQDIIKEDSLK